MVHAGVEAGELHAGLRGEPLDGGDGGRAGDDLTSAALTSSAA